MSDAANKLHADVMNIQAAPPIEVLSMTAMAAYKLGHRDARHAAAELVLQGAAKPAEWPEIDPSDAYPIG